MEGVNLKINGTKEEQDRAMDQVAEMSIKNRAFSALNLAFRDFLVASPKGDVDSFLQSEVFQVTVAKHEKNYRTTDGISEAVQKLKDKHKKPETKETESVDGVLDIKYRVGIQPVGKNPLQDSGSVPIFSEIDSLRLETDEEVNKRIGAKSDSALSPRNNTTEQVGDLIIKPAANDSVYKTEQQKETVKAETPTAPPNVPLAGNVVGEITPTIEVQDQVLPVESTVDLTQEKVIVDENQEETEVVSVNTLVVNREQLQVASELIQGIGEEDPPTAMIEEVLKVEPKVEEVTGASELDSSSSPIATPEDLPREAEVVDSRMERNEQLVFKEAVQEFTKSYVALFENIRRYNETTLDRNGRETSESILYNEDLDGIIAALRTENTDNGALDEVARLEKVRSYLSENIFPIKGGVQISSVEGYDFLIDSVDAFGESVREVYEKIKDVSEAEGFVKTLQQVSSTFVDFYDVISKKRKYTVDYLSR